ncbi:MAG TPA: glycogen debranching N-terminal domain-containing protein [Terriglobales bacterium]|nr:glycogen debranching N-terminal domain-containing protein [Terriglobales bacterium]
MSTQFAPSPEGLIEIPSPYVEPRVAFQAQEPRKVNNLTLIDGKTFLSTTVAGDISPAGAPDVGFFHDDTRFLSHLELRVGGARAVVLSSSTEKTFTSHIELTTGNLALRESFDLPENTVHIRREQLLVNDVFCDSISFDNYNRVPVEFMVEMAFGADFVDVFQVRGCVRRVHGKYFKPVHHGKLLEFHYAGLDGTMRQTRIEMAPAPSHTEDYAAHWDVRLEPGKRVQLQIWVTPSVQGRKSRARQVEFAEGESLRRRTQGEWEAQSTHFSSNQKVFDAALATATGDFHALLIPDGDQRIIAAGIPWFATIFGRDSIVAAYQTLVLNPQLACDTLRVLARRQGTRYDDWQDEEPGKILHEYREGEMTLDGEMPFHPYFGTVDATPLFLILLGETWNWTGDEQLVRDLLPAAYKALDWIDRYGDLDGDGFVEYQRRSKQGLTNQGWKDSWDANMHRDGTLARSPIALVEVQGYVYDAKYRMASVLRAMGDSKRADALRNEAAALAKRFEKAFWMPKEGFYAMALDADKRQLQVISSNPGHLLFTRILGRERARTVAARMMQSDMFTGWGWRTLSSAEPVFNPLSYHRGSVWPHDNSIVAHGMALNEIRKPALQCMTTLFQAALNFRDYRLPELFCGIQRRQHDAPVHYPVSCSPQAWASGAFFLMLASVLGIRPSAHKRELNIVNPILPDWMEHFSIRNLRIGNSRVGLDFNRHGERTFCNVVDVGGERLSVNVVFRR